MTALGSLTVTLSLGVGSAPTRDIATVEVPVTARVEGSAQGETRVALATAPDAFGKAIAGALREVADRFDPDVPDPEPTDLPTDLAPGAVILSCSQCDETMVGWPGESIEHADGDAHVWVSTYAAGPRP